MIALAAACGKRTLELLPDKLVEPHVAGAVGIAGVAVFPAAVVAAGVADLAVKHFEDRAHPGGLAELFRESLLHALRTCPPDSKGLLGASKADLAVMNLWKEGLESHGGSDWVAFLNETVPEEVVRAVSVEVGDESSYWPSLRALLLGYTAWFQRGDKPPELSPYLEQHLSKRLTPIFLESFLSKLASGAKQEEFRGALLALLRRINVELAPLDPLRTLDQMRGERGPLKHIDFLIARYRAIPYIGRRENINQLWGWLKSGEPVSLQAVAGRGGSGKTRFAYEFLEEIERRAPYEWHAGFVDLDEFEKLDAERFRYWHGRKPTLIVIDYAASATEILTSQVLSRLYNYCLANDRGVPRLRFLLLERTADERQGWYRDVLLEAREREKEMFPAAPLRLADLGPDDRLALLNEMLLALHRFDKRPDDPVFVPPDLAARLKAGPPLDPLVLGMAALVAHERKGFSATFDIDRLDLAREVAKHEERRINRLAKTAGQDGFLLLHMAAFVTLTGSLSAAELEEACEGERQHVAPHSRWAEDLYTVLTTRALPPERESAAVDPVVPDIVGEALVARILLGTEHKAEETVVRAAQIKLREVTRSLRRMIQDFAPANPGASDADVAEQRWALSLLTNLLRARARALRDEDFWAIRAELPLQSLAMSEAALDFYRAVVESRPGGLLAESVDLVALAARESQAVYTSGSGRRAEALQMTEQVVAIRRKLAEANPDAFLPDLATSLNNQATMQSEMRQRDVALQSIAEAVTIGRKLVETNPEAFLPHLAMSLNNQANRQSEMGQREAALQSIAEAVTQYRKLAEANPEAFLPNLAMSLNNQANSQSEMGQRDVALQSIAEAVTIRRKLAEANPDAFLRDLAASLNNQANSQSEMGQRDAALQSIAEAVTHYRKLAEANPDAFLRDLAASLNNQANRQSEMGQRDVALQSIAEAVTIRRKLGEANPDAFLPDLAMSCGAWGRIIQDQPGLAAERFGEGLRSIAPLFLRLPEAHIQTALMLARDYLEACEQGRIEPDARLIPVLNAIAGFLQDGQKASAVGGTS